MPGYSFTLAIEDLRPSTLQTWDTDANPADALSIRHDADGGDVLVCSRPTIAEAHEEHHDPAKAIDALAAFVSSSTARTLVATNGGEARVYQPGAWPTVRLTHDQHYRLNLTPR